MYKKFIIGLVLIAGLVANGCKENPFIVKIYAQTFPLNKTLSWDASIPSTVNGPADNYTVKINGNTIGAAVTGLTQAVVFPALGRYTFIVTANNQWGSSTASTLVVDVLLPAAPQNLKVNP